MSEKTSKRNPLLLTLCIVLAVAVILSVVLFNQRAHLSDQVDQLTADLSVSRTAWETTSSEKETLQAELTTAQNDLREAQTSLDESNAKIEELNAQITTLNGEIEQTKLALGTATDLNADLNTQIATLQTEKAALETSVQDLNTQITDLNAQIAALNEELTAAQEQVDTLSTQLQMDSTTDPATDVTTVDADSNDGIAATVNGQPILQSEVDVIVQNMLYSYSQYGYDTTNEEFLSSINQYALEYAIQLEVMEQKAAEWGLLTDEETTAAEAVAIAEWDDLIDTYITYYVTLAEDATDDEKAAARETAIAGLEEMGYTYDMLLSDCVRNALLNKVYAEAVKDAVVTEEDIQAAFNEQVEADKASYADNVATYEYMTQYYGQTSYYQPEGYRGITHILLEVDDDLLINYQTLLSVFNTQDPTATDTDLVTQEDVDAAYAAIIASVQPTIDEINQKLADGVSFDDLIAEYGKDPGMQSEPNKSEGYSVHADSVIWDSAFVQAAFSVDNVGDIAEPIVGSYGVHIVKYHRDVPSGAVELTDDIRASLQATLLESKQDELFNAAMTEWMNAAVIEYPTAVVTATDAE